MSQITIAHTEDGLVGVINGEPVSWDCDSNDVEYEGEMLHRERRFRIDLSDGYKLSVVFGDHAHGSNYEVDRYYSKTEFSEVATTAEIAVLEPNGNMSDLFYDDWDGEQICGYQDARQILGWVLEARRRIMAGHVDEQGRAGESSQPA